MYNEFFLILYLNVPVAQRLTRLFMIAFPSKYGRYDFQLLHVLLEDIPDGISEKSELVAE